MQHACAVVADETGMRYVFVTNGVAIDYGTISYVPHTELFYFESDPDSWQEGPNPPVLTDGLHSFAVQAQDSFYLSSQGTHKSYWFNPTLEAFELVGSSINYEYLFKNGALVPEGFLVC